MIEILALVVSVLAALGAAWMYWQVQQMERRIQEKEARLGEKVALVNELADELVIASRYLYDAMDRCIARIDALENQALAVRKEDPSAETQATTASAQDSLSQEMPAPPSAAADAEPALPPDSSAPVDAVVTLQATDEPEPAPPISTREATRTETPAAPWPPLSVHAQALAYAAQGEDLVEIARKTGLGVEELRLLLHFQGMAEQAA